MTLRSLSVLALLLPAGTPGLYASAPDPSPATVIGLHPSAVGEDRCDVPIRWRIAEVDERFGLTEEEAARAVRQAGLLWQEAMGHQLLFQESENGMAVRFVYDERQEAFDEQRRMEGELAELEAEADEARERVETAREELDQRRMAYESRSAAFRDRLTRHNREVQEWNDLGGAPEEEAEALRERQDGLEREREDLNREVAILNDMIARVNEMAADLQRIADEHGRLQETYEDRFAEAEAVVESGRYREIRRAIGSWTFSVFREVEIYHFHNPDHLVLVIAHELGHALGLEHSEAPGAVMGEVVPRLENGQPRLHRDDIAQLRAVCYPLLGRIPVSRPAA